MAAPDDLRQQGVNPIARLRPVGRVRTLSPDPVHQESGDLEPRQDVARAGVVGQQGGGRDRDDLLGGDAQQEVPLARLERGEHPACHPVCDRRVVSGVVTCRGDRVSRCAHRAGREDDGRAPALRQRGDRLEHLR